RRSPSPRTRRHPTSSSPSTSSRGTATRSRKASRSSSSTPVSNGNRTRTATTNPSTPPGPTAEPPSTSPSRKVLSSRGGWTAWSDRRSAAVCSWRSPGTWPTATRTPVWVSPTAPWSSWSTSVVPTTPHLRPRRVRKVGKRPTPRPKRPLTKKPPKKRKKTTRADHPSFPAPGAPAMIARAPGVFVPTHEYHCAYSAGDSRGGSMQRRYCYVSGIRLGVPALEELCARGRPRALVISYTAEYADSSGFNHFEDLARAHDLPHVRACDTNSEEVRQALTTHAIDLMVVAGWSQQVHEQALADLPLGGVGLHPTPLPVGRGHAPIPWTILRGMSASAVTLHHLASEVGAGDIVDQIWFDLPDDVTATGLYERISHLQSELLVRHIDDLLAGTAPRSPQSGHVSVWPPRRPSDGCLDLTASGTDVDRMVRALADPYPG